MKRAHRYAPKRFSRPQLDAMAEARAARKAEGPAPDYPPLHRLDVAVTITLQNHEAGTSHVLELRALRGGRCDQYALWLDGVEQPEASNKTEAMTLLRSLMPNVLGVRNLT